MTTPRSAGRLTRRSASFIAAVSLAGRVFERIAALGQILLVAAFFGASVRADLYFIASIIPLMIGGIGGEALYVSILPSLARRRRKDFSELAGAGFWVSACLLAAATGAYLAAAAVVVPIAEPAGNASLAPWLAFAPIGLLLGLGAYAAAVLLQLERYVWPPFRSAASAFVGLGLSALALWLTDDVVWVALALSAGYAVALTLLLAELVAVGGWRMLRLPTRAAVRELIGLRRRVLVSLTGGLLGGQAFVFIERLLAASLGVGAVAAISYARGVAFTPIVLGQSISLGMYPGMLRAHADRNLAYLRSSFVEGLRVTLVVAAGAAGYLWFFSDAIARFVFDRGELEGSSITEIDRTLGAFSVALVGTMLLVFTVRVFNALDFFRAIVWAQGAALVVYVALALPLRPSLGPAGLAFAFGLAELTAAALALYFASRRIALERPTFVQLVARPVVWRLALLLGAIGAASASLGPLGVSSPGARAGIGLAAAGAAGAATLWFAPWEELEGARSLARRLVLRRR